MERTFSEKFAKNWADKKRRKKKERELMKKRYNSLSLCERNAYEEIIERRNSDSSWILIFPFKLMIYLVIFGLIFLFLFEVDLFEAIRKIGSILFASYFLFILFFLITIIVTEDYISKLKRKLLLGK